MDLKENFLQMGKARAFLMLAKRVRLKEWLAELPCWSTG